MLHASGLEFLIVLGVLAVLFVAILWLWEWWIERPRSAEMAKRTYPPGKFESALNELLAKPRCEDDKTT